MKKKTNFVLALLIAVLATGFTSCGSDDHNMNEELQRTETISSKDPEGTIVLNMVSAAKDNYYDFGGTNVHVDEANNLEGYNSNAQFVALGKVNGLSDVTKIPTTGWARRVAVVPGTGYVMRYLSGNREIIFTRIFVVSYLETASSVGSEYGVSGISVGSNSGAVIKYQTPFELPIELESTTVRAKAVGDAYDYYSHYQYTTFDVTLKLKQLSSFEIDSDFRSCFIKSVNTDGSITVEFTAVWMGTDLYSGNIRIENSIGTTTVLVYLDE